MVEESPLPCVWLQAGHVGRRVWAVLEAPGGRILLSAWDLPKAGLPNFAALPDPMIADNHSIESGLSLLTVWFGRLTTMTQKPVSGSHPTVSTFVLMSESGQKAFLCTHTRH